MTTQEYLKQLMIARLGTSDDESAELISNIVDNANGGGGGGGGEPLPKVIFDGTIQGVETGKVFIAQFEEPLELVPGCSYTVKMDNLITDTDCQYVSSSQGYGLVASGAQISFRFVMLGDDSVHNLVVTQNTASKKQLIYQGNNVEFVARDGYSAPLNFGYIPNLAMGDYTVIFDGTVYNLRADVFTDVMGDKNPLAVFIGSPEVVSGETGEYPFYIDGEEIATSFESNTTHSFAIYGPRPESPTVTLCANSEMVLLDINAVGVDQDMVSTFENAYDLKQFIQNKIPTIQRWQNGVKYGDLIYPFGYSTPDVDNTVVYTRPDGTNTFLFGVGIISG